MNMVDRIIEVEDKVRERDAQIKDLQRGIRVNMNYIKKLQQENTEKDTRIAELEDQIAEVVRYLVLPKFSEDTSVSKYDILHMLGRY